MRRALSFLQVVCAALLLAGAPDALWAATRAKAPAPAPTVESSIEKAAKVPDVHPAEAAASEPGLPQLDPTHFPSQAFWLLIAFALTYGLMRYVALPKVENTLENRAARMDADLNEAKLHNEEAKRLSAELDLRMNDARTRAYESVQAAAHEQATRLAAATAEQQKKTDAQIRAAEARLNEQKKQALAALDGEAGTMVVSILKQLTGHAPTSDQAEKAWRSVKEV